MLLKNKLGTQTKSKEHRKGEASLTLLTAKSSWKTTSSGWILHLFSMHSPRYWHTTLILGHRKDTEDQKNWDEYLAKDSCTQGDILYPHQLEIT